MSVRRDHRRSPPRGSARPRVRPLAWIFTLVGLASLAACGGDGGTAPGALDRVLIDDPNRDTLFIDELVDLDAVALDANRREIVGLTASITWESSDPTVASVDPATGRVTANAAGVATITAKVNNKQDAVAFQVAYDVSSVQIHRDDGDSVRVGPT